MIKYEHAVVGALGVNCYAVYCSDTMHGIIIDPGANIGKITKMAEQIGLNIDAVVLTHAHFDHSAHADDLRKMYNVPIIIHEKEKEIAQSAYMNLSESFMSRPFSFEADILLKEGDEISFGNCCLKVLHTPGHTEGSMSLYADGILFSGDTLFCSTHGRTDFPTGDAHKLADSIKRLYVLPDETVVNPGHNQSTTVGKEKADNYVVKMLLENNQW